MIIKRSSTDVHASYRFLSLALCYRFIKNSFSLFFSGSFDILCL